VQERVQSYATSSSQSKHGERGTATRCLSNDLIHCRPCDVTRGIPPSTRALYDKYLRQSLPLLRRLRSTILRFASLSLSFVPSPRRPYDPRGFPSFLISTVPLPSSPSDRGEVDRPLSTVQNGENENGTPLSPSTENFGRDVARLPFSARDESQSRFSSTLGGRFLSLSLSLSLSPLLSVWLAIRRLVYLAISVVTVVVQTAEFRPVGGRVARSREAGLRIISATFARAIGVNGFLR